MQRWLARQLIAAQLKWPIATQMAIRISWGIALLAVFFQALRLEVGQHSWSSILLITGAGTLGAMLELQSKDRISRWREQEAYPDMEPTYRRLRRAGIAFEQVDLTPSICARAYFLLDDQQQALRLQGQLDSRTPMVTQRRRPSRL